MKKRLLLTQRELLDIWECVSEIAEQSLEDIDILPEQTRKMKRLEKLEKRLKALHGNEPEAQIVSVCVHLGDSDTEVRVLDGMVSKRKAKGWALKDMGLDWHEHQDEVHIYHEPVMVL